uniref:Adenylate kinase 8 n=1 Tax=Mastacembelus armatus TaxID=205130 RepID=A0A3Q3MZX5_9TELE
MDEITRPLRIPPQMSVYADKHNIFHLVQSLVSSLAIDQPEEPIPYLIRLLRRSSLHIPRVMVLGPPAAGKHTVVSSEPYSQSAETVCVLQGWVLDGIPQTRLQALSLQQAGVIPEHVVMLQAPDDVLLERSRGKLVDPLTGDVYHQTFIWPDDDIITQRLEKAQGPSEKQRLAELHHYHCEVPGLLSAYQHVLKTISSDQPHTDVYRQVLRFVQTRQCSRTPRILLLGPPGSGKSHQARLLSEKYKMVDVCCGRLLRAAAAGGSSLGAEIQPYLDDGRPVPDTLVLQVLEERLSRVDCSCRGWILHGFPCDLQQAKGLLESQHEPNRVFFLELTDDICLERITLGATDPVSGERFHAVTRPAPSSQVQNRLKTRPEDTSCSSLLYSGGDTGVCVQSVFPGAVHINADQDPHSVFEALESRLTTDSHELS